MQVLASTVDFTRDGKDDKDNQYIHVVEGHSFWLEKKVDEFFFIILMKGWNITYEMKLKFTD